MPTYSNSFLASAYIEQAILDRSGSVIGTIRIKPSTIMWKNARERQWRSVRLDQFVEWITSRRARAYSAKQ